MASVAAALVVIGLHGAAAAVAAGGEPPTAAARLELGDAAAFEAALTTDPGAAAGVLRDLGQRFVERPAQRQEIAAFVAETFRLRLARLAADGPARWRADEPRRLLTLAVFDPSRYAGDASFRELLEPTGVTTRLRAVPAPLREAVVEELGAETAATFDLAERLAVGLGVAPRSSRDREIAYSSAAFRCVDGGADPIVASFFVLPSTMFPHAEVARFLAAVLAHDPDRTVVVVADAAMRRVLSADAALARVRWVGSLGRNFSPWPRDPFLVCRRPQGGLVLLARPNLQPGREADADLARALVQGLPEDLDRGWGGVSWSRAPLPFHNGQVVFAGDAAWMSIHTVEPLNLRRLGLARVPVSEFGSAAGVAPYLAATRDSAAELGRFYGATPRFVHPLAADGDRAFAELMRQLGGGAGFDLDSLLTVLPVHSTAAPSALVGDLELGQRLVAEAPAPDLEALRDTYGLLPESAELRARLVGYQQSGRARALGAFLELAAGHLARQGLRVVRLPLLLVPTTLLDDGGAPDSADFLLTWANVVPERRGGTLRAEGFASGLPSGDALAIEAFRRTGCELRLLPPLPRSIVLNGGLRCASNHLRRAIR